MSKQATKVAKLVFKVIFEYAKTGRKSFKVLFMN